MFELIEILFDKKSATGKAFRTFYQGLGWFLLNLPLIIALPQVQELIETYPAWFVLYLNAGAAIVSFTQNNRGK